MTRVRVAIACALAGCAAAPRPTAPTETRTWGELRAVLHDGETQGRVDLALAAEPSTVALGLLEGLAGEITVDRGEVHVARVAADGGLALEGLAPGQRATLLVLARVPEWSESALAGGARDLDELENALAESLAPLDGGAVLPFRIEGRFVASLHVLDRSCPIAHPNGPAPWRLERAEVEGTLVGFYAENAEGRLTHHGRRTHIHALVRTHDGREVSGHVDEVSIRPGATLYLPRDDS